MTADWKRLVRARLAELGRSESWLAEQVSQQVGQSVKRDSINKMLNKQTASALVPAVCTVLEIPRPLVATRNAPDAETARVLELLRNAPDDMRTAALAMLEAYFRKR